MERRTFLRAGMAAGVASLSGIESLDATPLAPPRRQDGVIRLNSNENPLGLAPAARQAVIDGIADANRYPFENEYAFVQQLASRLRVRPEHLILGNGSTEVLQMAVQAFSTPDTTLLYAEPTFEDVPTYAQPYPFRTETVPLDVRYAHDIGWMSERASNAGGPVLAYICNPNNPTGTLTSSAEIDAWIESAADRVMFLVDEAYFEYVQDGRYWSAIKWIEQKPNVIVVRTFSKIYGMAGMRLGYGIAHPETARRVRSYIASNNANHLALEAGRASLRDPALVGRSLEINARGKRIAHAVFDELGLGYLESHTNFVMHEIRSDLRTYIQRMGERGIRVGRPFPPMLGFNRLSLGLPDEMERFAETLRDFRQRDWI